MNKEPAAERAVGIFPSRRRIDDVMLEEWVEASWGAVRRTGRFVAALSGGRTPVSFYRKLAATDRDLPWEKTHIFLADERAVPPGDPESNLRTLRANLLRHVPIPPGNVHPVPADRPIGAAARAYEKDLRDLFGLKERDLPRFDLILLGLGADGHTASLFPGSPGLAVRRRLAVAVARTEPDPSRVSLTLPVLNAARLVVFLVTGTEKAEALKSVLEGRRDTLPAALVRPKEGRCAFLVDEDSAALLSQPERAKWQRL